MSLYFTSSTSHKSSASRNGGSSCSRALCSAAWLSRRMRLSSGVGLASVRVEHVGMIFEEDGPGRGDAGA